MTFSNMTEDQRLDIGKYDWKVQSKMLYTDYLWGKIEKYKPENPKLIFGIEIAEKLEKTIYSENWCRAHDHRALIEIVIAVVNETLKIIANEKNTNKNGKEGVQCDFHDLSDAKTGTVRRHGGSYREYHAPITGLQRKDMLRALVLDPFNIEFYSFVFPRCSYEHLKAANRNGEGVKSSGIEIPFTSQLKPNTITKNGQGESWWNYRTTFENMCIAKPIDFPPSANSLFHPSRM